MQQTPTLRFPLFLEKFPEITLPITVTSELQVEFSRNNLPLPQLMISRFIAPIELEEIDEFTEFVPCFKLPKTEEFQAVIYWKGGLMNYQFILATFTPKGGLIDKAVIAGTYSDGESLVESVATIEEDLIIYIVTGKSLNSEKNYDASTSKTFDLELLPSGQIVSADIQ